MNVEANNIEPVANHPPSSSEAGGEGKEAEQERSRPLSPGQRLRAAREAAELTQEGIAAELRLDLKLIRALEEGDLEHLPEPVFTAGYLRSYARLVGLPADELVAQYVESETRDTPPLENHQGERHPHHRKVIHALTSSFSLSGDRPHKITRTGSPVVLVAGVVLVAIVAIWAAKSWLSNRVESLTQTSQTTPLDTPGSQGNESKAEAIPEKSKNMADLVDQGVSVRHKGNKTAGKGLHTKSTSDKQSPSTGTMIEKSLPIKPLPGAGGVSRAQPATTAAVSDADLTRLSLRFSDTSWVDIRDATGKRLIRELGLKGATKKIEGVAPFTVLLGYGPGVEIAYNGKSFDFSKYQGDRIARFTLHVKDDQLKAKPEAPGGLSDEKAPLPEPEDD